MKILLICSKNFYGQLDDISKKLKANGHEIFFPNCYDNPQTESLYRGTPEHAKFKAEMFKRSENTISQMDAVLTINMSKNGVENYIGGATFLELYDAFRLGKKIFLYNPPPQGILNDEIIGFSPIVINGNLDLVK